MSDVGFESHKFLMFHGWVSDFDWQLICLKSVKYFRKVETAESKFYKNPAFTSQAVHWDWHLIGPQIIEEAGNIKPEIKGDKTEFLRQRGKLESK